MLKWEGRWPQSPLKGMKYVVVSGGVLSGLAKELRLLASAFSKKCWTASDCCQNRILPNSDAGTMSPFEHGEVFVLDDGEADLDLGNYERFCDLNLFKNNNITTGKIYSKVIEAERGDYLERPSK